MFEITRRECHALYPICILLLTRVRIQLVVFCYKDIHVDRNENEDNRRVSSCPQSTISESLNVNMTQQIETRKRALHARMFHSTVCNTTISNKKTRRTQVKQVSQLRVTPHACKGNIPVNVKEKYVFVQGIKHGHRCV